MNITLKNVPVKVHRALKRAAKEEGRSLNAHIIHKLEMEAAILERRKKFASWRKELEQLRKSLPRIGDSTPLIREDRESHGTRSV
jgi:hypothetical protein